MSQTSEYVSSFVPPSDTVLDELWVTADPYVSDPHRRDSLRLVDLPKFDSPAVTSPPIPRERARLGRADHQARRDQRQWAVLFARRLALTDLLALLIAGVATLVLVHAHLAPLGFSPAAPAGISLTAGLVAVWLIALAVMDTRERRFIGRGHEEYKATVRASLLLFGFAVAAAYIFQRDLPREYVLVMLPIGLSFLLLSRFIQRRWLHRRRAQGEMMTRVLAVGDDRTVTELIRDLHRAPMVGYRVVGVCLPEGRTAPEFIDGIPVVGGLADVVSAVSLVHADSVAVTASGAVGPEAVRQLSWALEDTSANLMLAPALTNVAGPRIHTLPVAGLPLIHVDRPTYLNANRLLKRSFDIVGAVVLIVLSAPMLLGVALGVVLTSPGGAFFQQERVGLRGKRFRMIKFRSMVLDAEERLAALQQTQRDAGNEVLFKLKGDPRITPIGRFIRRFSLDELPQLFNVLLGTMSLVGPRPPLSREVAVYEEDARRRLLVKPGMTGLWQVSGRSDLTWDESVRLDVYYVENWSLVGDLVILWKTAKAVFSSSGAY